MLTPALLFVASAKRFFNLPSHILNGTAGHAEWHWLASSERYLLPPSITPNFANVNQRQAFTTIELAS